VIPVLDLPSERHHDSIMTTNPLAGFLVFLAAWLPLSAMAIPGGWAEVPVTDKQVMEAAEAACKAEAKALQKDGKAPSIALSRVLKAQHQVVAGMNYRLTLEVTSDGKKRPAEVIIWRKLSGEHNLTSWVWGGEAEPEIGKSKK